MVDAPRALLRRPVLLMAPLLAVCVILLAAGTASADQAPPGTPVARTFDGVPTVGALFASATTNRHSCTASVVASPEGDVLMTAAHCIGGTAIGYVFAPGYHGGVAPYGRWTVTAAYVDPQWETGQNPERDFAFLTVGPRRIGGRTVEIQQVTGANLLGPEAAPGQTVTIPAYPAGTTNDPVTCTVPVYFDGPYPAFDCNPYVGGTSGAPWLARTRLGSVVVGLIGGLHQGGCSSYTSYSAPLGAAAYRAYARAAARRAGDIVPAAGSDGCS